MSGSEFEVLFIAIVAVAVATWFGFRKRPFRRMLRPRRAGTLLAPTPVLPGDSERPSLSRGSFDTGVGGD